MKVLHIVAGNLFGGVESLLLTLARHRSECPEMEPHFALCFDGRASKELTEAGVPVYRLGEVRISRPWTVWRGRGRLRALLRREQFGAVVFHSSWPLAVFGRAANRCRVPGVLWVHGPPRRASWLDRWAYGNCPALTLCNSRFIEGEVRREFHGISTVHLYYPVNVRAEPFDGESRAALRRELQTPTDAVVIIQVSRMEAWKGHELHLKALAQLPRDREWRCWIVGGAQRASEQEYLSGIQRLAEELRLTDRVRFLGERRDVPNLLRAADIHCQPNQGAEPFGITFIEALAAGLPVVTTAIGAAPEIVNSNCGRLVTPDDSAELAKVLNELMSNAELRRALGAQGPGVASALCEPRKQLVHLMGLLTYRSSNEDMTAVEGGHSASSSSRPTQGCSPAH